VQVSFKLSRRNLKPLLLYQLFHTVRDKEIAALIDESYVSRTEPPIGRKTLSRSIGVPMVPTEHVRPFDVQLSNVSLFELARGAISEVATGTIEWLANLDFDVGQ
jgi:hypothetical protein